MERIRHLVTRLNLACESISDHRELIDAAARALGTLFPEATVAVFARSQDDLQVQVIGGIRVPSAWQNQVLRLSEIPPLALAMRHPERLIDQISRARWAQLRSGNTTLNAQQTTCAALSGGGEAEVAVLLLAPARSAHNPVRALAVKAVAALLNAKLRATDAGSQEVLAAIHRAKLEWELTVDALPEIVGLVDAEGRVVRISRAVEHWQMGTIRGAINRSLHDLLHPNCTDPGCALEEAFKNAFTELRDSPRVQFEHADPKLAIDLLVALQTGRQRGVRLPSAYAVFTLTNVTPLRRAESELLQLNQTLEHRVAERTKELQKTNSMLRLEIDRRRKAERALQRSKLELEELSERLMTAQEAERKRIAQDMHDSVGQTLSAIKYSLEQAQALLEPPAQRESVAIIERTVGRVQGLMEEVRGIAMNLRPALLDQFGAASAVRGLCRDWQEVYRSVDVLTDIAVSDSEVPSSLVSNVFRAVQESLNNVARHAGARRVVVSMQIVEELFVVSIVDDGIGFRLHGGEVGARGLGGLRERAERSGGRCEVTSAPGVGTTVRLEWPVTIEDAARLAGMNVN